MAHSSCSQGAAGLLGPWTSRLVIATEGDQCYHEGKQRLVRNGGEEKDFWENRKKSHHEAEVMVSQAKRVQKIE